MVLLGGRTAGEACEFPRLHDAKGASEAFETLEKRGARRWWPIETQENLTIRARGAVGNDEKRRGNRSDSCVPEGKRGQNPNVSDRQLDSRHAKTQGKRRCFASPRRVGHAEMQEKRMQITANWCESLGKTLAKTHHTRRKTRKNPTFLMRKRPFSTQKHQKPQCFRGGHPPVLGPLTPNPTHGVPRIATFLHIRYPEV